MKVIKSFNNQDASACVDFFKRPDGTWGFEQYRCDFEEGLWYPISNFREQVYRDELRTKWAAEASIPWFRELKVEPRITPLELELDYADIGWIAEFESGALGVFFHAGSGVLPFSTAEQVDQNQDLFFKILELPTSTEAQLHVCEEDESLRWTDWIDASERGLYGYDVKIPVNAWGQGYNLVSTPAKPLMRQQLDELLSIDLKLPRCKAVPGLGPCEPDDFEGI